MHSCYNSAYDVMPVYCYFTANNVNGTKVDILVEMNNLLVFIELLEGWYKRDEVC